MKIPKYIEKALDDREKAAYKFNSADYIISQFIEKHNIVAESYDYRSGVESIVNPSASAARIREAIINKEN